MSGAVSDRPALEYPPATDGFAGAVGAEGAGAGAGAASGAGGATAACPEPALPDSAGAGAGAGGAGAGLSAGGGGNCTGCSATEKVPTVGIITQRAPG